MENNRTIYGQHMEALETVMSEVVSYLEAARLTIAGKGTGDPVDHCMCRIKSDESMREKCRRLQLPENEHSALVLIRDAIGIRLVCPFIRDVFSMRNEIARLPECDLIEEKDYIHNAKPNGYRSYHMILRFRQRYFVEIQLRTISMDNWAALEHKMRYKKHIVGNQALIAEELKRCADELASTDMSMQTIRDMIYGIEEELP